MTKRVYQDIVYLLHTYLMVIYKENTLVRKYLQIQMKTTVWRGVWGVESLEQIAKKNLYCTYLHYLLTNLHTSSYKEN